LGVPAVIGVADGVADVGCGGGLERWGVSFEGAHQTLL
jgi:hypothetical protein